MHQKLWLEVSALFWSDDKEMKRLRNELYATDVKASAQNKAVASNESMDADGIRNMVYPTPLSTYTESDKSPPLIDSADKKAVGTNVRTPAAVSPVSPTARMDKDGKRLMLGSSITNSSRLEFTPEDAEDKDDAEHKGHLDKKNKAKVKPAKKKK